MSIADLSNTLEKFIKNTKFDVVECNKPPSNADQDIFGHLIESVYTLQLTYKPTGKSMTVIYEKSIYEPQENMKYAVMSSLKNELRDFRCGGWRRIVDQYGMFYANRELVSSTGVTEATNKAWEEHKKAVQELLAEDYSKFLLAF